MVRAWAVIFYVIDERHQHWTDHGKRQPPAIYGSIRNHLSTYVFSFHLLSPKTDAKTASESKKLSHDAFNVNALQFWSWRNFAVRNVGSREISLDYP